MKSLVGVLLLLLLTQLVGCSYISKHTYVQHRDREYLMAKTIPPLKIPPDISTDAFHSYYPVPHREYPEAAKDVSMVPPGL